MSERHTLRRATIATGPGWANASCSACMWNYGSNITSDVRRAAIAHEPSHFNGEDQEEWVQPFAAPDGGSDG